MLRIFCKKHDDMPNRVSCKSPKPPTGSASYVSAFIGVEHSDPKCACDLLTASRLNYSHCESLRCRLVSLQNLILTPTYAPTFGDSLRRGCVDLQHNAVCKHSCFCMRGLYRIRFSELGLLLARLGAFGMLGPTKCRAKVKGSY